MKNVGWNKYQRNKETSSRLIIPLEDYKYFFGINENDMVIKLSRVMLDKSNLFTPKAYIAKQKPMYRASFLIPKNSELDKEIRNAIIEVAKAKWAGLTSLDSIRPEKIFYHEEGNVMVLRAASEAKPLVVDRRKSLLTKACNIINRRRNVDASVEILAQEDESGKSIIAKLRAVKYYETAKYYKTAISNKKR